MKFTFSYEQTSWNNFYKPYYAIDNERVTKDYFDYMINKCEFENMSYNTSSLICKNNRYKAEFHYN